MGSQLTCPSGSSWYLEDFSTLALKSPVSIFDGTFNLCFRTDDRDGRSIAIKAFQLSDKSAVSIAQSFYQLFADRCTLSREMTSSNIISRPFLSKNNAYLMRKYVGIPLTERVAINPPLEMWEKKWIAFQLLKAVDNLKTLSMYHGDMKPENVLIKANLETFLVDHAPYKPMTLMPNQPNYFIHFFSYGKRNAYIAPERISDVIKEQPDMFAADLFSLGCILAYLFTDGKSLFDFSSLLQYKRNQNIEENPNLKILDLIEDKDMKRLVLDLIDIDPKKRILASQNETNYFPEWIKMYYDFYVINFPKQNKLTVIHKHISTIRNILMADDSDGILIYLVYLAELFAKQQSISDLTFLIRYYESFAIHMKDIRIKVSRILPPLMFLFEKQSNLISGLALDTIINVVKSINVPEEVEKENQSKKYENSNDNEETLTDEEKNQKKQYNPLEDITVKYFVKAFFIPNLAKALKLKNTKNAIISRLPTLLVDFSRIWPSILDDLPSKGDFYLQMLPMSGINKPLDSESPSSIVKAFLSNARKTSSTKNYQVFCAIFRIVFQMLNTKSYIPRFVEFLISFLRRLSHSDKVDFYSYFYYQVQNVILSYVCENPEDISLIFDAFTTMVKDGQIMNSSYSAIAQLIYQHIGSTSPTARATARILLRHIPQIYSDYSILGITNPQGIIRQISMKPTSQHQIEQIVDKRNTKNKKSFKTKTRNSQKLSEENYQLDDENEQKIPSNLGLNSNFFVSYKLANSTIDKILLIENQPNLIPQNAQSSQVSKVNPNSLTCFIKDGLNIISKYNCNLQGKPQLKKDSYEFRSTTNVINIESFKYQNCFFTTSDKIVLHMNGKDETIFTTKGHEIQSAGLIGARSMVLEIGNVISSFDISPKGIFQKKSSYQMNQINCNNNAQSMKKVLKWNVGSIFSLVSHDGYHIIFDERIGMPIAQQRFSEINDAVILPNYSFAIMQNSGVSVYRFGDFFNPLYEIQGHTDSIMKIENSLILLNQFGTFEVNFDKPNENADAASTINGKAFCLRDKNKNIILKQEINDNISFLKLPTINRHTLHYHSFPVVCCANAKRGALCFSGDTAGYVNLWSVFAPKK